MHIHELLMELTIGMLIDPSWIVKFMGFTFTLWIVGVIVGLVHSIYLTFKD
uniref:Uncharacterized protein n=1 Tax=viral metagenome TaxID=1070528 RepID=A0A6M3KB73_9ZZZZ